MADAKSRDGHRRRSSRRMPLGPPPVRRDRRDRDGARRLPSRCRRRLDRRRRRTAADRLRRHAAGAPTASFTSRVKSLFAGHSGQLLAAAPDAPGAPAAIGRFDCPTGRYRQGAATLAVNDPGGRECGAQPALPGELRADRPRMHLRGGELTIKVGVQGRIVVGPAGAPGTDHGAAALCAGARRHRARTIWTKLFIGPGHDARTASSTCRSPTSKRK